MIVLLLPFTFRLWVFMIVLLLPFTFRLWES